MKELQFAKTGSELPVPLAKTGSELPVSGQASAAGSLLPLPGSRQQNGFSGRRARLAPDVSDAGSSQLSVLESVLGSDLETVFTSFASNNGKNRMDEESFLIVCLDSQLVGKGFSVNDVSSIYKEVSAGAPADGISMAQFEEALKTIAKKHFRFSDEVSVREYIVQSFSSNSTQVAPTVAEARVVDPAAGAAPVVATPVVLLAIPAASSVVAAVPATPSAPEQTQNGRAPVPATASPRKHKITKDGAEPQILGYLKTKQGPS